MPYFEYTSLPYCCDVFRDVKKQNFAFAKQNNILEPLLKDKYEVLYSNAGNVFNFNTSM